MDRSPNEKYGRHLCRRLLETYDGCDAGVRGAAITLVEADTYVEGLVSEVERLTLQVAAQNEALRLSGRARADLTQALEAARADVLIMRDLWHKCERTGFDLLRGQETLERLLARLTTSPKGERRIRPGLVPLEPPAEERG